MPPDHNQQHSRRPHYHRGRRGPDRRGGDRRPPQSPQPQESANRDQLDVEQIMREIRSRISERHGIDLTAQQIQELAARRLEAILDPRIIKPSLMDELRRAAGLPADTPPSEPEGDETIAESALYQSESGFVRAVRKMLNPLLKLFFNPAAIVDALNAQTRRAKAAEAREAELRRRQTEWNALHFEVLRRLVTDVARAEIDNQHLAHRVESLTARVDFNERRVRGVEHSQHSQHAQHTQQPARPSSSRPPDTAVVSSSPSAPPPREESPSIEHASSDASPEGSRRRRRRRRGRRSGQLRDSGGVATPGGASAAAGDQGTDGDEFDDEPTAEELIDEANNVASTVADEPVAAVDFSAPPLTSLEPSSSTDSFESDSPAPDPFDTPPAAEESLHVVSSPVEQASPSQETSPTSSLEPTERPEPVPPDRS